MKTVSRLVFIPALILAAIMACLALPSPAQAGDPVINPGLAGEAPGLSAIRLSLLADRLAQVPDSRYNHSWWGNGDDPRSESFVGCAAGHATGLFYAEGLRIENLPVKHSSRQQCRIAYAGSFDKDACAKFFGISPEHSAYLFGPRHGPSESRSAAIERIREVASWNAPRAGLASVPKFGPSICTLVD